MKTNFATAAIAATYLAISAQGQNMFRFLQDDTCEPEAQATGKYFDASYIDEEGVSGNSKLCLKGLNDRALCTDGEQIEMGLDNRAWVMQEDANGPESYKPNYLSGSLKYVVDVSDIGCNCAAGVFLVALDGDKCNMNEYEKGTTPNCPSVDIMKANKEGFKTQSHINGEYCKSYDLKAD